MLRKIDSNGFALVLLGSSFLLSIMMAAFVFFQAPTNIAAWAVALVGLGLIIGISASVVRRVQIQIRKAQRTQSPRHYGRRRVIRIGQSAADVWRTIDDWLRQQSWPALNHILNNAATVKRGGGGDWGSIIFHLGLIVIILSTFLAVWGGARTQFMLTEGEAIQIPPPGRELNGEYDSELGMSTPFSVSLEKFDPLYASAGGSNAAGIIRITGGETDFNGLIQWGHATSIGDYNLYLKQWGYSPGIILIDASNTELLNGFIRLARKRENDRWIHEDYIILTNGDSVTIRFTPPTGRISLASIDHGARTALPAVHIELFRDRNLMFVGDIAQGRTLAASDYFVGFQKTNYWARFEMAGNRRASIILLGCSLIVIGLAVRLLRVEQRLSISVTETEIGTEVIFSGWAERYRHSYQHDLDEAIAEYIELIRANPVPKPVARIESMRLYAAG